MLRNNPNNDTEAAQHIFTDIGLAWQASWIPQVVKTWLTHGLITPARTVFEPDKDVTRAEAYAMIMKSVCLKMPTSDASNWQQNLYAAVSSAWLTVRSWNTFEPNTPILRQELFTISARAADWAERTGGCTPKPASCSARAADWAERTGGCTPKPASCVL